MQSLGYYPTQSHARIARLNCSFLAVPAVAVVGGQFRKTPQIRAHDCRQRAKQPPPHAHAAKLL
jgi:hypothetical protein